MELVCDYLMCGIQKQKNIMELVYDCFMCGTAYGELSISVQNNIWYETKHQKKSRNRYQYIYVCVYIYTLKTWYIKHHKSLQIEGLCDM